MCYRFSVNKDVCEMMTMNSLRLSSGLGEDAQQKLGLLVGMERTRNDDILARLQLAVT